MSSIAYCSESEQTGMGGKENRLIIFSTQHKVPTAQHRYVYMQMYIPQHTKAVLLIAQNAFWLEKIAVTATKPVGAILP